MIVYDSKRKRYRDAKGRFISPRAVRRQIDRVTEVVRDDLKAIGKSLATGAVTIGAWQILMRDKLKTAHSLVSAIGKGGRKQMTNADWGKVGAGLKKQYSYLNRLAKDIELGKVVAAFQIERRSAAYAMSLRPAYYGLATVAEQAGDAILVRRVINSKEGCAECESYADDFIPIDEMPPIGSLQCSVFCLCTLEFSN